MAERKKKPVKILSFLVKVFISLGAITWFASTVEWRQVLVMFNQVNYVFLLAGFLVFLFRMVPCSTRWLLVCKTSGYPVSFWESFYGYMVGGFFNTFLPSGRGGDVARSVIIGRYKKYSIGGLMGTILLERFAGLLVTVLIALLAGLVASEQVEALRNALPSILLLTVLLVVAGVLMFQPVFQTLFRKITAKLPLQKLWKAVDDMLSVFAGYRSRPAAIGGVAVFSLFNQIVFVTSGYIVGQAINGFNAPWYSFWIVVPLIFIAELIPSIGGYGIREAGFVVFFGWFGVKPESAVVYGLVQLSFMWLSALIGVVMFMTGLRGSKQHLEDIQQVDEQDLVVEPHE